jgi:hypothetical protein
MSDILDEATTGSSYVASMVAHDVVARLEAQDPELLLGWLKENAHLLVRLMIIKRDGTNRNHARRGQAGAGQFLEAVKQAKKGDTSALSDWLNTVYVVDGKLTRKRLRDMTVAEVLYAADSYQARARTNLLQAALLKAVAKKMGNRSGTVVEILDNTQLNLLWAHELGE